MGPPVGDVTFFGPKEASWGPPLVTLSFLDQRSAGEWGPLFMPLHFLDQKRSFVGVCLVLASINEYVY